MKYIQSIVIILIIFLFLSGCARNISATKQSQKQFYTVMGKTYWPLKEVRNGFCQHGIASWYGPGFNGKKTASNEIYDMHGLTAAHNVLPLNTLVKIINLNNQKEVVVRINDRGPFVGDRIVDLSLAAARQLDIVRNGTAPVRLAVIGSTNSPCAPKRQISDTRTARLAAPNPFYVAGTKSLLAFVKD